MEVLTMVGQVILALAILITLHELGHFWAARFFGIRVEKFYLFFDAWGLKLFSYKKGDTEYGIGWLPLGGYVKIAGMVDESLDKEQMSTEPMPWEFRSKPAWQRLIVMLGGVTVNAILGIFIISCSLAYYGDDYLPNKNVKYGIHAYSLGKKVGFVSGDKLVSVDGKAIENFEDAVNPEILLKDFSKYKVDRNGTEVIVTLPKEFADKLTKEGKDSGFIQARTKFRIEGARKGTPAFAAGLTKGDIILSVDNNPITYYQELKGALRTNSTQKFKILRGKDTLVKNVAMKDALIVGFDAEFYELKDLVKTEHFTFFQAIPEGIKKSKELISSQLLAFGKMFKGELDPRKSLGGPFQIGIMFGSEWKCEHFWGLTAMISIVLAFMNLLPIPALDGGHVLFLLVEMVIRRPLPEKFMYVMQVFGMIVLFALMIFIFGNDIFQIWFNK